MKQIPYGDVDVFSPFGNQLKYQGHTCISLEIPPTIFKLHQFIIRIVSSGLHWNTRDMALHVYPWKYLAQFLNFIIQIVSSCLHCKIPDHIDFLLLTMYWNLHDKLHVEGVFQNRNLGFFFHSIKWTLFKPWGVYKYHIIWEKGAACINILQKTIDTLCCYSIGSAFITETYICGLGAIIF